jgi:DNA-binding transcriptional ArsR family regulator
VVELLGSGPRRAGDLAQAAGMSAPAMSRHLRVLLAAGVIVDERVPTDARLRVFRLRPESLVAMQAWLDQLQAHWSEQLGAFGQHVSRRLAEDQRIPGAEGQRIPAAEEPGGRA